MSDLPPLRALGGEPPPPQLPAELRSWSMLPARVRKIFWTFLQPNLAPNLDERTMKAVRERFREHEVKDPEALAPMVKACRFLMREAAKRDITPEVFVEDIRLLVGDDEELVSATGRYYEEAYPLLRTEIVGSTLAQHGLVATDVHWRVDMVTRSDHGLGVNRPVVMLTFVYRDGKAEKSISLQMVPETLAKVRDACEQILD